MKRRRERKITTRSKSTTKDSDAGTDPLDQPKFVLSLSTLSQILTCIILQLDLICAPTNALLSVIEPEKCEYLFTVSTPAVCFPLVDTKAGDEQDVREKTEL